MTRHLAALGATLVAIGLTSQPARALEARFDTALAAYRWEEHIPPYRSPKESGPVVLLGGFISGSPSGTAPALTLRGDLRAMLGRVNYDTSLISSPTTSVNTRTTYVGLTHEGSVGWRMEGSRASVEPFLGLAYRLWLRYIESNSSVTGYSEWYYTVYERIGLRWAYRLRERAGLYGVFSVDPMIWAREEIEDFVPETLRVRNGTRPGWTLEAGVRGGTADVGLYWQATRLGRSNLVACPIPPNFLCGQPESDQDIIGVRIGTRF